MSPDESRRDPKSRREAPSKQTHATQDALDEARAEVERTAAAYFGGPRATREADAKAYHRALDREEEALRRHREASAPAKPRRAAPAFSGQDERETA